MTRPTALVILTGAGVSAESGLATFRGAGGLWEGHPVEQVATPEGFLTDPRLVQRFYDQRRRQLLSDAVAPNAAHHALARLDAAWDGALLLVTQNVDDLHERAGCRRLVHMHGELLKARCTASGQVFEARDDLGPADAAGASTNLADATPADHGNEDATPDDPASDAAARDVARLGKACPCCGRAGGLRPHIVWFGEMPFHMDQIEAALAACDLFVSIGTSGNVYPAAGFHSLARRHGARTLELNLEPSEASSLFDERRHGPASEVVPAWVEEALGE